MKPKTFGELKEQLGAGVHRSPTVKDEIRKNLVSKLRHDEPIFPGIVGYEESVIPALVNALLSRHNLVLLGLRGQAKSRILRALTDFLDQEIPCIQGCEINDDPFFPICATCRRRSREEGQNLPLTYRTREQRYIEKLATPDVTIADIIGDLDPIKAAKESRELSAQENIHFGLLPRAHRGIFAINELPDLAPKIQVGLFNIMQEGDVQIKGFPLRLPLDVLLVFSANPEDYTARGKIITPLKDRIGSEIRTHYPQALSDGIRITRQESWTERDGETALQIPDFISEIVEEVAFLGRRDSRIDRRSGVSQRLPISCLENVISNGERRALLTKEPKLTLRVADVYASIPAVTGKLELEYEGEVRGASRVAGDLIQRAVLKAFRRHFGNSNFDQIVQWFDLGGEVKVTDKTSSREYLKRVKPIQGFDKVLSQRGVDLKGDPEMAASLVEFVLEGLTALKKLSRSEDRGYFKEPEKQEEQYFGDLPVKEKRSFN